MTRQTASALATILLQLRVRTIRCEGLIALSEEHCSLCSRYSMQIAPVMAEINAIRKIVDALLDAFVKEVQP